MTASLSLRAEGVAIPPQWLLWWDNPFEIPRGVYPAPSKTRLFRLRLAMTEQGAGLGMTFLCNRLLKIGVINGEVT